MLFNSVVFIFGFLPICYVVFWLLRSADARYRWLTVSGYVFYGYWDARFCLLMAFSTLVSYTAGLGFLRWEDPRRRKLCLVIPVTVDGKPRGTITVDRNADESAVLAAGLGVEVVARLVAGRELARVVFVPGKILNLVTRPAAGSPRP